MTNDIARPYYAAAEMAPPIPPTADYAISPIEGTQVFRSLPGNPDQVTSFIVRCCCGFKTATLSEPEMAEYAREQHEAVCLWPKS